MLGAPGVAHGIARYGGPEHHHQYARPTIGAPTEAIRQESDVIPIFVNPARTVLYPGERVLLAVGGAWVTAELTLEGWILSGNLRSAGTFVPGPGPFVTYRAPSGRGDVEIAVTGICNGTAGSGTVRFAVEP